MTVDLLNCFAQQAHETPDAVAIEAAGIECSYRSLQRRALAVSHALRAAGCGPGDRIAVWSGDRAAFVAVMLGVVGAGAVFAPLESDASIKRLRHRLKQLRPRALLHDASAARVASDHLAGAAVPECCCIAIPDQAAGRELADRPAIPPPVRGTPAYIYFTSGSSGQPKGIVGTLAALGQRIAWELESFSVQPGTRCSQLIAPTFDPWFRDILVPLCAGGTIVLPPDSPSRLEPERLLEWLRDQRIELMHCGPSLMNALVAAPPRIRRLPQLRTVLSAGEPLHVSLVRRWRRRFGAGVELVNLYGATEATMMQFAHRLDPEDAMRDFIPVGKPLPGVTVRLIDADGAPREQGQTGELLVGGPALSLGYLDDEAATERAFVHRGPDSEEIFYRTGDVGIEYEPGGYRLLGRIDDQVKIRGVRVEPREVEDALIGYPLIATCAVVARPDSHGEPSLIAYVVPETNYAPAVPEMRSYLRERFPPQYLPAAFVMLKALPLTATGKVDRQRLPHPGTAAAAPTAGAHATAPRNELEAALAEHWREILGLPQIGIDEDFLDIGGHSLSAMRLVGAISESGFGELSLLEIFDHRTIAAQAMLLRQRASAGSFAEDGAQHAMSIARDARPPLLREDGHGFNLILVQSWGVDRESLERTARTVTQIDDQIDASVVEDVPGWDEDLPRRPTLVVSPGLLRHRPARAVAVCCGYPLSKSEEYRILEHAGIAVPRWILLERETQPDLSGFGPYVVRKPDYGAKGAEVQIVRRGRIRWKPILTSSAGLSTRLLVQEFVYTGKWPVSFRVNTLFGQALYCVRITANSARHALEGPEDFEGRGDQRGSPSIVSNARDSSAAFCQDADIIALGERAAHAFPDVPLLGVDILKNALTGELLVTEVNSMGHNWTFGPEFTAMIHLDVEQQFDGVRRAARILVKETHRRADAEPAETTPAKATVMEAFQDLHSSQESGR